MVGGKVKSAINKIRSRVTFFNFFLGATVFGVVVLLISVFINFKYVSDMTTKITKTQMEVEWILNDITEGEESNKAVSSSRSVSKDEFMQQYYLVQSDWLNKWLTALAIIMAILGIMVPICFVKFLENKEKEMNRIIDDARKQKDEMEIHVEKMEQQLSEVMAESEAITVKSQKMSQELAEVKEYVATAQSESIYMEAKSEYENGHISEAIELLYKAKNHKISNKICNLLGKCFFSKNYLNKAIKAYSEAIELDKNDDIAFNERARCYHHKKQYDEALSDINEAISLNSKNNKYRLNKMLFLVSFDKVKYKADAEKLIETARNKYGYDWVVLNILGLISSKIDNYELAINLLESSMKLVFQPYAQYYNLARVYILQGNYKKALTKLKEFIKVDEKKQNLGIYDDDYELWKDKILSSEQNDFSTNLLEFLKNVKKTKRTGEDD